MIPALLLFLALAGPALAGDLFALFEGLQSGVALGDALLLDLFCECRGFWRPGLRSRPVDLTLTLGDPLRRMFPPRRSAFLCRDAQEVGNIEAVVVHGFLHRTAYYIKSRFSYFLKLADKLVSKSVCRNFSFPFNVTICDKKVLAAFLVFSAQALAGDLPDPTLTPGLADPALTKEVLCAPGFTTRRVRNVPSAEKRKVYARYGMTPHKGTCASKEGCEVDHLIPLTIGGSNDVTNLWPQPYRGKWSAHVKDRLENKLRGWVCHGDLDLGEAQRAIATDWISMYKEHFQ